jgi:hypothetical protein
MSKLTEQQRTAMIAALAGVLGAVTVAALDGDPSKPTLPETAQAVGKRLDPALSVDPAKYKETIAPAKAAHPGLIDLFSAPCDPGEACTTGGNFPKGTKLESVAMTSTGFSAPVATCRDDAEFTWCEVTATNESGRVQRLSAFVEVEGAP